MEGFLQFLADNWLLILAVGIVSVVFFIRGFVEQQRGGPKK